jgi:hypothetical protein
VRPDPQVKAQWLGTVEDLKTKLPFSKIRTAMNSLYPAEQKALAEADRGAAPGATAGDRQGSRPGLHAQRMPTR